MNKEQVITLLEKQHFIRSTYQQYKEDYRQPNKAFVDTQFGANEHNLKNYLPSIVRGKKIKKFFIIELAQGRFDIKVWAY